MIKRIVLAAFLAGAAGTATAAGGHGPELLSADVNLSNKVALQRGADLLERFGRGAGVEVNRHAITGRGQPFGLLDDCLGVFMAQQDIRDFRHSGDNTALISFIVDLDKAEAGLNKPYCSSFNAGRANCANSRARTADRGADEWVSPAHG